MAKFSFAILSALVASAAAFVTPKASNANTALEPSKSEIWDPLGLYELGSGEAFDTFPNCFPDKQFLEAAEIKHGRQAMLAWTGVWATTEVGVPNICQDAVECSLMAFSHHFAELPRLEQKGWIRTWTSLPWIPRGC